MQWIKASGELFVAGTVPSAVGVEPMGRARALIYPTKGQIAFMAPDGPGKRSRAGRKRLVLEWLPKTYTSLNSRMENLAGEVFSALLTKSNFRNCRYYDAGLLQSRRLFMPLVTDFIRATHLACCQIST